VQRISRLNDAFSANLTLEVSPVEGLNNCSKKIRRGEKGKVKKKKKIIIIIVKRLKAHVANSKF